MREGCVDERITGPAKNELPRIALGKRTPRRDQSGGESADSLSHEGTRQELTACRPRPGIAILPSPMQIPNLAHWRR
jgi:hypothetical protein